MTINSNSPEVRPCSFKSWMRPSWNPGGRSLAASATLGGNPLDFEVRTKFLGKRTVFLSLLRNTSLRPISHIHIRLIVDVSQVWRSWYGLGKILRKLSILNPREVTHDSHLEGGPDNPVRTLCRSNLLPPPPFLLHRRSLQCFDHSIKTNWQFFDSFIPEVSTR